MVFSLSRASIVIRLTRMDEFIGFVLVTTFFGFNVAGAHQVSIPLAAVLAGNLLAVAFAFMINDVEDAPDDARDANKVNRNPISAGYVSTRTAYIACFAVAMGAAACYAMAGWRPFLLGVLSLLLGLLYSWRVVRLKAIPGADLVSHVLLLAALQFLCAYFTFQASGWRWLIPCSFVVMISLYGQLFNQLRDWEGDRLAGYVNTAGLVGERLSQWLVYSVIPIALLLLALCVVQGIIPVRILLLAAGLAPIVLFRQLRVTSTFWRKSGRRYSSDSAQVRTLNSLDPTYDRARDPSSDVTGPFQEPMVIIGVVTMLAWWLGAAIGV